MGLFSKKSRYQKDCEEKIEELCGGFLYNENFENRLRLHNKTTKTISHDRVKSILKHECEDGKLALENIESRMDELLELDCNTLDLKIRMTNKQDTSIFKTQNDIVNYMGKDYEIEYNRKLEKNKGKIEYKLSKKEGHFDFETGITVNLFAPEFGLMLNYQDSDDITSYVFEISGVPMNHDGVTEIFLTTLMQVLDNQIIFKDALTDGGDFELPFESISYIEKTDDRRMTLGLEENQSIQIKFIVDDIWSEKEIINYLESEFLDLVSKEDDGFNDEAVGDSGSHSNVDELLKLAKLYEGGFLTKEEFEAEKSKIIKSERPEVCPECKTPLSENDTFCPQCGRSI